MSDRKLAIVPLQPTRPDAILRTLADHWSLGMLFTSRDVPDGVKLDQVFFSIGLCNAQQRVRYMEDAVLIFAYRDTSGTGDPHSGLPIFMQCEKLNAADVELFDRYCEEGGGSMVEPETDKPAVPMPTVKRSVVPMFDRRGPNGGGNAA